MISLRSGAGIIDQILSCTRMGVESIYNRRFWRLDKHLRAIWVRDAYKQTVPLHSNSIFFFTSHPYHYYQSYYYPSKYYFPQGNGIRQGHIQAAVTQPFATPLLNLGSTLATANFAYHLYLAKRPRGSVPGA